MKSLFNDFKFKVEDFDDILWANYSESNITKLWKASDTKDMWWNLAIKKLDVSNRVQIQ